MRATSLLTTDEKFDAITSDPFDPWVKGAATLYTKEFFEVMQGTPESGRRGHRVRAALRERHGRSEERGRHVPRGLPERRRLRQHATRAAATTWCWSARSRPGQADRRRSHAAEAVDAREYAPVAHSLGEIGFFSAIDLLGRFAAQGPQLKPWLADAQINRDRNLRLQYLAGFGLNAYEQARIYSEILQHRDWPQGLFTGSPETIEALRTAIATAQ